jgi:hypothetical protein
VKAYIPLRRSFLTLPKPSHTTTKLNGINKLIIIEGQLRGNEARNPTRGYKKGHIEARTVKAWPTTSGADYIEKGTAKV